MMIKLFNGGRDPKMIASPMYKLVTKPLNTHTHTI